MCICINMLLKKKDNLLEKDGHRNRLGEILQPNNRSVKSIPTLRNVFITDDTFVSSIISIIHIRKYTSTYLCLNV